MRWRCGRSARLSPMWPGIHSDPVPYAFLTLLFVFALLQGIFSGFSGLLPPRKPTSPNSSSTKKEDLPTKPAKGWSDFLSKYVIYLIKHDQRIVFSIDFLKRLLRGLTYSTLKFMRSTACGKSIFSIESH